MNKFRILQSVAVLGWITVSLVRCGQFGLKQDPPTDPPSTAAGKVALTKAKDCSDLLILLKKDAIARVNLEIDSQIEYLKFPRQSNVLYGSDEGNLPAGAAGAGGTSAPTGGGGSGPSGSGGTGTSQGGNAGSFAGTGGSGGLGAPPTDGGLNGGKFSETNQQTVGVDEADIIKTDGSYLYILHGDSLVVMNAFPEETLGNTQYIKIEGKPVEMFADADSITVYSLVPADGVFKEAGVVVDQSPFDRAEQQSNDPSTSGYSGRLLTKITVFGKTTDGIIANAEHYLEGSYLSARKIEKSVMTVVEGGARSPSFSLYPTFDPNHLPSTTEEYIKAYEELREESKNIIDKSALNDWLPYRFRRDKSSNRLVSEQLSCSDFYVPTDGSTTYGLTQVVSFQTDQPTTLQGSSVVGRSDTVYANETSFYIVGRGYQLFSKQSYNKVTPTEPWTVNHSHIHKFSLDDSRRRINYQSSTSLPGTVHNQFSIDEYKENLRVSTLETRIVYRGSGAKGDTNKLSQVQRNHIFTLQSSKERFEQLGTLELAEGTAPVSFTRFINDRAFLFHTNTDPVMTVVDLSQPATPTFRGALNDSNVKGISYYVHPVSATELLTVGKSTTTNSNNQPVSELNVNLFDITNLESPTLTSTFTFSASGNGYSEVEQTHKAFVYLPDKNIFAFPFVSTPSNGSNLRSSFEIFRLESGVGFQQIGSIDHSSLFQDAPNGYCGGRFDIMVRRGLFIENNVYTISYGGVLVHHLDDLSTLSNSTVLKAPVAPDFLGCPADQPSGPTMGTGTGGTSGG
jgi:hypothetical protein